MEEGQKGKEGKEKILPDEWKEIPIQDYFDMGFRPYVEQKGERKYIGLRKGNRFKSLGPYDSDKWELLKSMYPYRLPEPSPDNPPIDTRIEQLKKDGYGRRDIAQTLYNEGYSTRDMMSRGYPPNLISKKKKGEALSDESVRMTIAGAARGPGYLDELKKMIRAQISLSREFAEACTNAGVQVVFSALKRTNLSTDEVRQIFKNVEALTNVVDKATETALKALEYYDSERIERLEEERNEARVAYSLAAAQLKEMQRRMKPKAILERLLYAYIVSGNTDANMLTALIDKLLSLEMGELQSKVVAREPGRYD